MAGTTPLMISPTIEGIPAQSLVAAMLRAASDPSQRARLYDILGTYCHQCRNTLNSLRLSIYLAKRESGSEGLALWADLEPNCRAVEEFIDRLQWIVRPMSLRLVRLPLSMLMDEHGAAWSELMAARGRTLDLIPPPVPAFVSFDPFHLGKALEALVAWRAEVGPSGEPASLRWRVEAGESHLEWIEHQASRLESSVELTESLALPLVARVASAHGGTVSVDARDGLRVSLCWPADASSSKEEHP